MVGMKKTLENILEKIPRGMLETDVTPPDSDLKSVEIEHIEFDSRAVKPGTLFFALPGTHTTGNKFIASAIENGAAAVIYEGTISDEEQEKIQEASQKAGRRVPLIKVPSSRKAMSPVSASFYDDPSSHMVVYGVTGTEGKSSTVAFIWQLLTKCGIKAGFISTVQYSLGGEAVNNPQHQTTPEAPIVQRELYEMLQNGCTHAVVESSSHGLSETLNRLGNVHFDCAVFMNVTLEHLEFHKTYEQYKSDKANLFRALDKWSHSKILGMSGNKETEVTSFGIINAEDEASPYFAKATSKPVVAFAKESASTYTDKEIPLSKIKDIKASSSEVSFTLEASSLKDSAQVKVTSPTPGAFNSYNISAAMLAVNGTTGISFAELADKVKDLVSVTGRMTVINQGQPFEVIVDYAHTPSSFQTIFPPIKDRCSGKMIAVFGSAGERDVTKRPLQGAIAARYCDTLILTDEDPRQEDSHAIIEMIARGARLEGKTDGDSIIIQSDRKQALRKAFSIAKENDIVLLLGKSHENSIIYKDYTMPYDEIAEAKKALQEMGFKGEVK